MDAMRYDAAIMEVMPSRWDKHLKTTDHDEEGRPDHGIYICDLHLQGARWCPIDRTVGLRKADLNGPLSDS
eukprot:7413126-Pyramimonas_sp.AAC.1